MSRPKRNDPRPAPASPSTGSDLDVNGTFVAVGKHSHLLYEAFAVVIKHGEVVEVKPLSRAPDLVANAVGACAAEIWQVLPRQSAQRLSGAPDAD